MKFNHKILTHLALALFIFSVIACTSHKNINHSEMGAETTDISTDMNSNSGMSSADQVAQVQIEELQKTSVVYFDFDKYNIKPNFAEILNAHANFLLNNPSFKVYIEGHTDQSGTSEYNMALGERRANAVKIYLQGKGVFAEQMSIVSYGKEKLVYRGNNKEDYSQNRRAVLIY
ncbi:peptidoglycan-associated lipoprotein Pal [Candidatus Williamhamiltonella defendens]|uniref:peptidoglycan-associated lipoprotein Pal n=1 Tax=Candidatus Williamhamiltonella defendens TaxID=138072 RepID=UPI00130E460A|nr:peptidoglycan-associated lipoprotein Pal [Candidatus Hamiltonella defensa]